MVNIRLLTFFLVAAALGVKGDEAADKASCFKTSRKMLKGYMKLYMTCNKELGMLDKTADQYHDSLGCVIKCVMNKLEVLDETQNISEAVLKDHIENHIPESKRKHAHEELMKCVKLHDDLNPKDPSCKVYQKLGHCMQEALSDLCGEMPMI